MAGSEPGDALVKILAPVTLDYKISRVALYSTVAKTHVAAEY